MFPWQLDISVGDSLKVLSILWVSSPPLLFLSPQVSRNLPLHSKTNVILTLDRLCVLVVVLVSSQQWSDCGVVCPGAPQGVTRGHERSTPSWHLTHGSDHSCNWLPLSFCTLSLPMGGTSMRACVCVCYIMFQKQNHWTDWMAPYP